jgi:hypothetical protein
MYVITAYMTQCDTGSLLSGSLNYTSSVFAANIREAMKGIVENQRNEQDACTVHRSRVEPHKECESCGNARFHERKGCSLLSNVKTFASQINK